ncbi:MAG: pilus assembly protein [Rhodospirillales bacterium]|nr:pilus assembly protein [Rhodospirillales bacterium]MBT4005735.1 pilus assembly protein [Rhodospirillales bacterium]MBT5075519.1 pilus assembly protein [Rhodospirillales bacterium]MBT5113390.1 pilus assembly protein [Rhodospirillales bacterium]MBT5672216.1 pilus assembly protein [Rhodospirillales bacterium]
MSDSFVKFCKFCARFRRASKGSIAVEFALLVPVILTIFLVLTEVGRALYQANAVEKGVRAGAMFVSRTTLPLNAADQATAENLVRTGDPVGTAVLLASGWGLPGASLNIDADGSFDPGAGAVAVITIAAQVPFDPLMPGLMAYFGLGSGYQIAAMHQQPYVGN